MAKKREWPWATPKGRIITIVVVASAAILAVAGLVYYLVYVVKPAPRPPEANNQFAQSINTLLKEPVPDDPISKAIFYALIAQNYDNIGDREHALQYYLHAQQVIDDNKLADQIVYYRPIADDYLGINDKENARKYLRLQKAHLQAFLESHPDDEPTKNAITDTNNKLNELSEP